VFEAAEKVGDQPTADLAVTRQQLHEKSAWMLRSFLES
jgi:starvation-inducible DNA-binding protein